MSKYTFANSFRTTLAGGGMSSSVTALTPTTVTGAPTADPTLATPTQFSLLVDYDPATGLPTSLTEVMTVTDSRTSPWTVVRASESVVGGCAAGAPVAHAAGVAVTASLTSGGLGSIASPFFANLGDYTVPGSPVDGNVLTRNTTSGMVEERTPGSVPVEIVYAENVTTTITGPIVPTTSGVRNTSLTDIPSCTVTITGPYTRPIYFWFKATIQQTVNGNGLIWLVLQETTTPASGQMPAKYSPFVPLNPATLASGKNDTFTCRGAHRLGPVTDTTARTFKLSLTASGSSTTAPTFQALNGSDGSGSHLIAEAH